MNQTKLQRLLSELTPAIRAYLFPGMSFEGKKFDADASVDDEPLYNCCPADEPCDIRRLNLDDWDWGAARVKKSVSAPVKRKLYYITQREEEESLDPRTEQILAEIRRLQEKYGVSIDELEVVLGYTVKLSQIRILRSGKIYLPAYDNIEIRMPNVAKSLYFLYLRHPEGLRFKDVADHRDELVHIYSSITGRDDLQEIIKSIDILVDPFSNALNVNASRIKTAFRNVVSDRIARFYYINGAAGDVKKVPLDRDLVIWEY